jgi:hypothetical protein
MMNGEGKSPVFCCEVFQCNTGCNCVQANLCYVDIDSQTIQLPEELPSFPQLAEFVGELVDVLTKHKVSCGQVDRWVARCSVCRHAHWA